MQKQPKYNFKPKIDSLRVMQTLALMIPLVLTTETVLAEEAEVEPPPVQQPTDFSQRVRMLFPTIDDNRDGFLSGEELDYAVLDNGISGNDAATLAALRSSADKVGDLSDDEYCGEDDITLNDLRAYEQLPLNDALRRDAEGWYRNYRGKLMQNPSLYGRTQPLPSFWTVEQGNCGNCGAIAIIAGEAMRRAQDLADMIVDNGDDTFTVTFPGGEQVVIDAPTDTERAIYETADGYWPIVITKAIGTYLNQNSFFPTIIPTEATQGASVSTVLSLLTGHEVDADDLLVTAEETTHEKLTDAVLQGRSVVAYTRKARLSNGRWNGIIANHAYTVIGYDSADRTIALRNPWGNTEFGNDGDDDGIFSMSLDDFHWNFEYVVYEQAADAAGVIQGPAGPDSSPSGEESQSTYVISNDSPDPSQSESPGEGTLTFLGPQSTGEFGKVKYLVAFSHTGGGAITEMTFGVNPINASVSRITVEGTDLAGLAPEYVNLKIDQDGNAVGAVILSSSGALGFPRNATTTIVEVELSIDLPKDGSPASFGISGSLDFEAIRADKVNQQ